MHSIIITQFCNKTRFSNLLRGRLRSYPLDASGSQVRITQSCLAYNLADNLEWNNYIRLSLLWRHVNSVSLTCNSQLVPHAVRGTLWCRFLFRWPAGLESGSLTITITLPRHLLIRRQNIGKTDESVGLSNNRRRLLLLLSKLDAFCLFRGGFIGLAPPNSQCRTLDTKVCL
jgi:hypothetical protein